MGLPVTVYSHTDVGAPSAAPRNVADWLVILKACLVDGYGSKSPLGWSLEFEDIATSKVVYKNKVSDGGSGGAVQFQQSPLDGANLRITCAGEITALDTFTKKIGYKVLPTTTFTSYCSGWMIIGTSRGFWMIQEAGSSNSGTTNNLGSPAVADKCPYFFIGDVDTVIPNDVNVFTFLTSTYLSGITDSDFSGRYGCFMHDNYNARAALYATDGSLDIVNYDCNLSNSSVDADNASTALVYDIDTTVVFNQALLVRGSHTIEHPCVRAKIPGLFRGYTAGYRGVAIPITLTFGGIDFRMVNGYREAVWFIQCSGTWYD